MKVTVSERFQRHLPEHSKKELAALEANCLEDPKHTRLPPVILWANQPKGSNTIIDGHHQWAIRSKNKLKIRYDRLHFATAEEALAWAEQAQQGRRNMSESQLAMIAVTNGNDMDATTKAEMARVSKRTIERAKRISANSTPAVVNGIKNGKITINDAEKNIHLPKAEQTKLAKAADKNGSTMTKQRAKAEKIPTPKGRISGGVSFDVDEIEAAKPRKPTKNGSAVIPAKTRQAMITNISKLVRQCDELGIYDEFDDCFTQLIKRVKTI